MKLPKKRVITTKSRNKMNWWKRFIHRKEIMRFIRKVESGVIKTIKDGCSYVDNTEFDYQLVAYRFIAMKYKLILAKNRFGGIYNIVLWK